MDGILNETVLLPFTFVIEKSPNVITSNTFYLLSISYKNIFLVFMGKKKDCHEYEAAF